MSFHFSKLRKARLEHRCRGCYCTIKPGTIYTDGSGMFEGDFYHYKHCPRCTSMYAAYSAYMTDTTRKNYRYSCSDEWLSFEDFNSEVKEWLDWFDLEDIAADKNLTALVELLPVGTKERYQLNRPEGN